jgi:hypothetical protein
VDNLRHADRRNLLRNLDSVNERGKIIPKTPEAALVVAQASLFTAQPTSGVRMAMGRVEQYHTYTHTHIVDGYKILPIPVPMGIKLYPYAYPAGTHTRWVPNR